MSTTPANGEISSAIAALGASTIAAVATAVTVARASVAIVAVVVVSRIELVSTWTRLATHRPRPRAARAGTRVDGTTTVVVIANIVVDVARGVAMRGPGRRDDRANDRATNERTNQLATAVVFVYFSP